MSNVTNYKLTINVSPHFLPSSVALANLHVIMRNGCSQGAWLDFHCPRNSAGESLWKATDTSANIRRKHTSQGEKRYS
jgi:hypothetical protein